MFRHIDKTIVACLIALMLSWPLVAEVDVYEFESDAARERYQTLLRELRCPKCQNQNLSDSDAQIAQDLRREVSRLVDEGNSDNDIKTFMVDRYGDFVLYRPPVQGNTLVLWWSPVIMLAIGILIFAVIVITRRKKAQFESDDVSDDTDEDVVDEDMVEEK